MQHEYPNLFGPPALRPNPRPHERPAGEQRPESGYVENVRRIRQGNAYHISADVVLFLSDGSRLTVRGVVASTKGVAWPCSTRTAPGDSCIVFGGSEAQAHAEALLKAAAWRENNDPPPAGGRTGTAARERAA